MSSEMWIFMLGDLNEGFEAIGPYSSFDECIEDNACFVERGCAMLLQPVAYDEVDDYNVDKAAVDDNNDDDDEEYLDAFIGLE